MTYLYWIGLFTQLLGQPCESYVTGNFIDEEIDGCNFLIQDQDSTLLQPINLHEFSIEPEISRPFRFDYETSSGSVSTCMKGEIISLICIEYMD